MWAIFSFSTSWSTEGIRGGYRLPTKCTLSEIGVLGLGVYIIIKQQFVLATLPVATTNPLGVCPCARRQLPLLPSSLQGVQGCSCQLAQKWTPKNRQVPCVPAKHSTRYALSSDALRPTQAKQASSLTVFDPCSVNSFSSF